MAAHPDAIRAVEITKHRPYLDLCDPDHPAYDPRYLAVVARICGSPPPVTVETPAAPIPLVFPPCSERGPMVESGEGCGCGPKHLCRRDTRVVAAGDCAACGGQVTVTST